MNRKGSKTASQEDLLASFKKYRIVTVILIVLFISQNLLALLELPSKFLNIPTLYYNQERVRIRENEDKLRQLKNGVSINFVESLFGKAKFVNDLRMQCTPNTEEYIWSCDNKYMQKEYIFQFPDFILKGVTDTDSNLVMYSITTLNKNFRPKLPVFFNRITDLYEIQLGVTKFADLPPPNNDFFLYVEREGLMSGNGGNGGFNKIYRSDDYAAFDNYIFQTSYDSRALTGIMNDECPISNLDTMYTDATDEQIQKNLDEFEKKCTISTIKYVSQRSTGIELENKPEDYLDYVEIWY